MPRVTSNLDALIPRADFAATGDGGIQSSDNFQQIHLHNLIGESNYIYKMLRKPDFQRETNQWSPQQIATLVESFLEGELIPSVILWRSESSNIFVIDGGHRLSALLAWAKNDYGDGTTSHIFFNNEVPRHQKRVADATRAEIQRRIGTYVDWSEKFRNLDAITDSKERRWAGNFSSRGLPVQWINGDADKAESSFFKINSQGTALDPIETKILKNRNKPPAIVARSIVRAATGHKYWSRFDSDTQEKIQKEAKASHALLFSPEVTNPIRTLDLPIGGANSNAKALDLIISIAEIADNKHRTLGSVENDPDGKETIALLINTRRVLERICGNAPGSLGLHPAVWFYNQQGRQSEHLLLGIMSIFQRKIQENNQNFFLRFTVARTRIENYLVENKDILSRFISAVASGSRQDRAVDMLNLIINAGMFDQSMPSLEVVAATMKLGSRAIIISERAGSEFTDEVKSAAFIRSALSAAIRCPICSAYLEPSRSITYDHKDDKKLGGDGSVANCSLAHPFCNSAKDALVPLIEASIWNALGKASDTTLAAQN
jgi:hypothetical protein